MNWRKSLRRFTQAKKRLCLKRFRHKEEVKNMKESTAKKPVEKIQESVQEVAKAETTSRPTRQYRTYLFQFMLIATTSAFAILTFLVKTVPSFPIDLAITRAIQLINFPLFDTFMSVSYTHLTLPTSDLV